MTDTDDRPDRATHPTPTPTQRRRVREAGILAALAAGPATVREVAAMGHYDYIESVGRDHAARGDLAELSDRGLIVRGRCRETPHGAHPITYGLPSGAEPAPESSVQETVAPRYATPAAWSLEEVLCWLAQGEGLPAAAAFERGRHKAVAGIRAAIDDRDRKAKEDGWQAPVGGGGG